MVCAGQPVVSAEGGREGVWARGRFLEGRWAEGRVAGTAHDDPQWAAEQAHEAATGVEVGWWVVVGMIEAALGAGKLAGGGVGGWWARIGERAVRVYTG